MWKMITTSGMFALTLSNVANAVPAYNECYSAGPTGMCYFSSLNAHPEKHYYFHCEHSWLSVYVHFANHNLLVSGFTPGGGPGAGTLSVSGLHLGKILDNYYFEVKRDPGHDGTKYVYWVSDWGVKCKLGKGGRPWPYPGIFGR